MIVILGPKIIIDELVVTNSPELRIYRNNTTSLNLVGCGFSELIIMRARALFPYAL